MKIQKGRMQSFQKLKQGFSFLALIFGFGLLMAGSGLLTGCASAGAPPLTQAQEAADQEATEQRAKEMLSETNPRNMNEQPKAVPEFRTRLRTRCSP